MEELLYITPITCEVDSKGMRYNEYIHNTLLCSSQIRIIFVDVVMM